MDYDNLDKLKDAINCNKLNDVIADKEKVDKDNIITPLCTQCSNSCMPNCSPGCINGGQ
ncbi:hypothetical protein SAMN02746089_00616 [Caldanaerobius fijiensis DSM 17918]|uniref:Six-cysteine peptide SCIFF n=1 Tax=Caldanaerobius fijiensis DSM 17918 TaxID=1121256 RepID=A0A1M4VFW7_9THEO|nr:hypothetical protein [Caldanaerobius fijiensis]SHE67792.1 hypothetical protein SAMN02746089_00616 [Caldanaerobius fijiensis DSM 17918]